LRAPSYRLSRALGHDFRRPELLEQALTHRSAGAPHNERLEFLGDALLDLFMAETLFQRFAQADEGQLSRLRSGLVKKESLAALARGLALGDYLQLGAGELRTGGHTRDSILADALEALVAAVYLDAGIDQARAMVLRLFGERLDQLGPDQTLKDPKTCLQEYLQARKHPLPEYEILAITGSAHAQEFSVVCRVPTLTLETQGTGSSRRDAEQTAAARLLDLDRKSVV
jgi:ribonuclease-3